jgi:hydrogenase-4 component E
MAAAVPLKYLLDANALIGALFIITTFLLMTSRQVQGFLRYFVVQSILLAASAAVLAWVHLSVELVIVAVITLVAKTIVIPGLLTRTLAVSVRSRREVDLVLTIPISLLLAIVISVLSYFLVAPFVHLTPPGAAVNLPIGLDVLLIGVYTLAVRREAIPQMLAIMAIDNGAFFAGIAITTTSAIVELAAGLEGVTVVLVVAILARTIALQVGNTAVSELVALKEGDAR